MFFLPRYYKSPGFMLGVREMVPQSPGIAAWGLMTGVAMVNSGMSVTEALAMTFLVFAGSAQLAATPLIVAGAPAWVILATAVCVNLRFVVFSLHLRDFLKHLPLSHRLGFGYLTADLSYVLFTKRYAHAGQTPEERELHVSYLAGSFFMNWLTWISASVVGVLTAQAIPSAWGLGFAGTLCLIGVMCSLASTRLRLLSAGTAAVVALLAYHVPLRMNIVLAIAAAVGVSMVMESRLRALPPIRKDGHGR